MSDNKKITFSCNCGWIGTLLIVFSILISTGVWVPSSDFFLWRWLNFNYSIVVPILTIIFVPAIAALLIWALMIVFVVVIVWLAYKFS